MKRAFFAAIFIVLAHVVLAQEGHKTVTVTPGEEYKAGFFHRFLFGSNWRDLWATPIEAGILDLKTFAGGLRPTKRGGGFQTKSLRFKGNNGKEYKFRSLNKDPRKILDSALRESLIGSVVQDFISTSNPLSALITTPILNSENVLNSSYTVVVLPNDPILGEFQAEFAGLLGTLEENPRGGGEDDGFAGSDKVKGTLDLFAKLDEDNDNYVDAAEYLKARMLDIYFGDWDRHVDQWRWAGYKEGKRTRWVPIPRDRDQAFCCYRGFVPFIVAQQVPQIESCDDSYPWINDLTWSGRHTDRRFLSSLEKPVWDSLKAFVLFHLTDSLIDQAVHELPKEMFEKEGENLIKLMKSRRDKFSSAIEEYYWNTSCYVDVWASDKPEFAEVTRVNDDSVNIALFKRDKETGGKKGEPFFERAFDRCYTKEIRVYLQGGDDYAKVSGNVNGSIQVRIIGGEGKDELVDSSNVRGFLWSILPFKTNKKRTLFYESGDKTEFVYGSSTEVDDSKFVRPPEDSLLYEPLYRDWGHEWKGFPWLGYNTDDGLFVGAIAKLTSYSFRSIPYQNQMDFRFGYAIKAERFRGVYDALFPNVWHGTLGIFARASGLEVLNYFGLGNETTYDNEKVDAGYYKIRQQQYIFAPSYEYKVVNNFSVKGFGSLRYFKTPLDELPDSSLIKMTKPYGTDNALVTTWGASGTYDSRNSKNFPEKGIYASIASAWTPEVMDNTYAYTRAVGDVRAYVTAPVLAGITLAVRARAEKIWGEHPFYESAFLGGPNDLRGFTRERFAGDASLLGAAELRVNLGKFFILVPGNYGFTVSAESGKVSVRKQPESDKWHASIDWGLWITPIDKDNVISVTVASSAERTSVILGGSFGF